MLRLSFRQTMLAGFLLSAGLLAWAALGGWLLLERYAEASRLAGERAVRVRSALQGVAERTVDLERSARQFAIVGNPALRQRFVDSAKHAGAALARLEELPAEALGSLPQDWRQALVRLAGELHDGAAADPARLSAAVRELSRINRELDAGAQRWLDAQGKQLVDELEAGRQRLAYWLALAVGAALLVALAIDGWLSRPLVNLEQAIERLGASRFDVPVKLGGPADLRRLGRRVDWLRRRLAEVETEQMQALRHVSHELKTPLAALREGIALLQDGVVGVLAAPQGEVVDILQNKALTLQHRIEGLLRLNAVAVDARRLNTRMLDLRQLLDDAVGAQQLTIQARGVSVRCTAPAVRCLVDGDKLRVAIDNLLSNAIDFSPAGGVIELRATRDGALLRIVCRDQGPGVAPTDAERIFAPFVQGERAPPMPRQGSGVGLSIVREVMAALDGRVVLLAADGEATGAAFMLELPWGDQD